MERNQDLEKKRALAPLEFVVAALGGLCLTALLLLLPAVFYADGAFLGLNERGACVETALSGSSSTVNRPLSDLLGGDATPSAVTLCDWAPSTTEHLLVVATKLPHAAFTAGVLLLLWRLTRRARHAGFFVGDIARGVGQLGWFVLVGGLASEFIDAWARTRLSHLIASEGPLAITLENLHGVWAPLLVGCGLLTVSRVLAQAVPMQHELDATV